ncbi:MAG: hypothetical protein HYY43_01610 [Deltaproteobacteria bacterium]|nr:hypothetical protein [Deltaproteobacteria bacterium]MBI2974273.1 hypothetical protein [Deltaproteobacteria bacterium]
MAPPEVKPAPKTVYVLSDSYEQTDSQFYTRERLCVKNHLWSNHESYFEKSADSFFGAGADPNFRFLRLKNGSPEYNYCSSIATSADGAPSKLHIELTSDDQFEMISFTKEKGSWKMMKKDIGWEEAFAFVLTNNRFSGEKWEIHKIAEGEEPPKDCQTKEALSTYASILKTEIVPLIADKKIAEAAAKALDEAILKTDPKDGSAGIPVGAIDSALSDAIREAALGWRKEHEKKMPKVEDERYKLHQQLCALVQEVRSYIILRDCEVATFQHECLDSKLSRLPIIAHFDQTSLEQMQKAVDDLKKLLDMPNRLAGGDLARKILLMEKNLKTVKDFFASYSAVDWLLIRQASGPIKLANCDFTQTCQPLEKPDQNMWLEGSEIIDFMQAFYSNVLPSIPDPADRKEIRTTVETALKEAGNLDETPLSVIDTDTGGKIRNILSKNLVFITAKKLVLYQNMVETIRIIGETALVGDWTNQGLPPLPTKLPLFEEVNDKEMVKMADIMVANARARIPPYDKNSRMLKFLEETAIPLQAEIAAWAKAYHSVQKSLFYLQGQPGNAIKLMAAGAVYGIGGYLIETGDVLVSLPTVSTENGSALSMGKAAGANDSGNGLVQRDWEKVMLSWKVRGVFDVEYPYLSEIKDVAEVKFGQRKVPVKISSKLIPEVNIAEFSAYIQNEIGKIPPSAPFGEDYLEKLAQYGISGIVVVPESFIWHCHCAEASILARKAVALFKHDPKAAIVLLKAAAAKFSYTPAGMYVPKRKLILLNADQLYDRNAFLHELAHADEEARKAVGILTPKLLEEINRQQNQFIKNNPERRFSNHTEVANNSPNSAAERRADGLVAYWINRAILSKAAPDLYNYFLASTMALEAKEVNIKDAKGIRKETGLKLTTPKSSFSKSAGGLIKWITSNPFSSTYYLECLIRAGTQDRWVSTTGCRFLPEAK